jgi:hypothetical protein
MNPGEADCKQASERGLFGAAFDFCRFDLIMGATV